MKTFSLILILFLLKFQSQAQDTTFLNKDWDTVASKVHDGYYKIMSKNSKDTNFVVVHTYYSNGKKYAQTPYSNYNEREITGVAKDWYENGKLKSEVNFVKNSFEGVLKTYWSNGKLKRKDFYKNSDWVSGKCFDENGKEIEHFDYRTSPSYVGGNEALNLFLYNNLNYPEEAREEEIEGKVLVKFIVSKDGTIINPKVIQNAHPSLDKEALRVINKMPKWNPGLIDGEPAKFFFTVPISFVLN